MTCNTVLNTGVVAHLRFFGFFLGGVVASGDVPGWGSVRLVAGYSCFVSRCGSGVSSRPAVVVSMWTRVIQR